MTRSAVGEPGGILNPKAGEKKFQLSRLLPSEDLKFFVEYYWVVTWDLRDQEPYLSENLPYPTVHLVIEKRSRTSSVSSPENFPSCSKRRVGHLALNSDRALFILS